MIIKWIDLPKAARDIIVDYNVDPEIIRKDAYDACDDYRSNLKEGRDAVFMTYETLIDWWDNCDEDTQREILGLEPTPDVTNEFPPQGI